MKRLIAAAALTLATGHGVPARAAAPADVPVSPPAAAAGPVVVAPYRLQPGDVLQITVWKETELQAEVLVRPDGGVTFPLAGELLAATRSIDELRMDLEARLRKYIPDVVVTVAVKTLAGNRIYVLGKVARPGDFPLIRPTDVMQALSLAGGTTPFADTDAIRILRRDGASLRALQFRYTDVERGRRLEQNIALQAGDTVVVP